MRVRKHMQGDNATREGVLHSNLEVRRIAPCYGDGRRHFLLSLGIALMPGYLIRPLSPADRARVREFITRRWGAEIVVAHGVVYHPHELPGFVAWRGDEMVGLVTCHVEGSACEIVTVDSAQPGVGIGTALIDAVKAFARQANCPRLWLITTNDNLRALRFYQKRGFALVAVHRHAVDEARKVKPQIPLIGDDGIPLRDEIELEMILESDG